LPIADVREEISVVDQANKVNTNPDDNLNVIKLDTADLKSLPVLGNDVVAAISNLADASSVGTGECRSSSTESKRPTKFRRT